MTIDEAIEYLHQRSTDLLDKDGTGKGFVCPVCQSGTGRNGTGIQTKDNVHFTCFARGCFTNADIIDIIGTRDNIPADNFIDRLKAACNEYNITLDNTPPKATKKTPKKTVKESSPVETITEAEKQKNKKYIEQCHKAVNGTDYWSTRGITEQTIERFNLGYSESKRSIVIPIGEHGYKERSTEEHRFYNSKGVPVCLYNEAAINDTDTVYIAEGEIDALSIEETGHPAIAIRGTANADKLGELAKKKGKGKTFILCLDNDEPGKTAAKKIKADLEKLDISYIDLQPILKYYNVKDANEFLVKYRAELERITGSSTEEIRREAYTKKRSTAAYVNDFLDGVAESVSTPPIKTGFNNFDELTGGLYEGVYTIGAISSLGKTSFIQQIVDNIAASGKDVLIFSLEMSRTELIAKSISRLTYEYCVRTGAPINKCAKSSIAITDGTRYKTYDQEELAVINIAIKQYKEYSGHIFIEENNGHTSIADVERIVADHVKQMGKAPVIVVDYLQLLAPPQERLTDKQAVDITTVRLKKLSRDYKTPVICISSFNRENYNMPVSFAAFKESGNIEYTSNVVMGLQLKGVGNPGFDVDEAKKKNPRSIELKILKNRSGKTGDLLYYDYYPQFSCFWPMGAPKEEKKR